MVLVLVIIYKKECCEIIQSKMNVKKSGLIDGKQWCEVGEVMEVPKEFERLVASGEGTPVKAAPKKQTAAAKKPETPEACNALSQEK